MRDAAIGPAGSSGSPKRRLRSWKASTLIVVDGVDVGGLERAN